MTRRSHGADTKAVSRYLTRPVACMALTFIVSVLQICLAAESVKESVEESLDGLQLFFSATERVDGQLQDGVPGQGSKQGSKQAVLANGESSVVTTKRQSLVPDSSAREVQTNKHHLWLNGVVRTEQSLLPMINDLPCQAIPLGNSNQVEKIEPLNCVHIDSNLYSLKLRTSDYGLMVYRRHKHVATLYSGQRL